MPEWKDYTTEEQKKPYFDKLYHFINKEYETYTCYPAYDKIFNAIQTTSYDNTKVVILGQDPYHEPNQAMGLAFSVEPTSAIPRSLQNMI